jgi:uncharacterized damage-inducible protein DinB
MLSNITLILAQSDSGDQNKRFKEEFIMMWDRSESYSLDMLKTAGDSLLNFKPDDSMQSFSELFLHMSQSIRALSSGFIDSEVILDIPRSAKGLTNQDLVDITKRSFDHVRSVLARLDNKKLDEEITFFSGDQFSRRHVFRVLHSHTVHHRAQCATYLRMSGKIPPRFVGW